METYMIWIWLGIFIITLIVEAVTMDLVSCWFSLGSIVAIILSLLDNIPYYYEIITFVLVSLVFLILTRPLVNKLLKNQIRPTNSDEFIGKEVIVIEPISKFNGGSIKINDVIYKAILPEDVSYECAKEEVVRIIALKGNKVIVRKISREEF